MRILNYQNCFFSAVFLLGISFHGFSQTGQVNVQQNEIIPSLLNTKSEMTKDLKLGDRYMIQLFNGDNNAASDVIKQYRANSNVYPSQILYETPNYKVLVGNFRNRLEAERALLKIKNDFPSAFIPKPRRG